MISAKAVARPARRWHPVSLSDNKRVVLYPFRKRDPLAAKSYRTRWQTSLEEIGTPGGSVDGAGDDICCEHRQLDAAKYSTVLQTAASLWGERDRPREELRGDVGL